MRKQENDFIKPTFGKMDTLIARFVTYIDDEAPKRGEASGQNKAKLLLTSTDGSIEEKNGLSNNQGVRIEAESEDYKTLLEKCKRLELKLNTTKGYFENVLSHTEEKSTGLNRKPVIELPIGDINEYRKYLKTL